MRARNRPASSFFVWTDDDIVHFSAHVRNSTAQSAEEDQKLIRPMGVVAGFIQMMKDTVLRGQ
jgi:hypothetical protein